MTADEKIAELRKGWVRHLQECGVDGVEKIVALASISGLFDPAKELYFLQELAADRRYSPEFIGIQMRERLTGIEG